MREYLIKRFMLLIPTFIGITLVVYSVLLMLPGDPVDVLLGQEYDAQIAAKLRAGGDWTIPSSCNTANGCGISCRAIGDARCFPGSRSSTRS